MIAQSTPPGEFHYIALPLTPSIDLEEVKVRAMLPSDLASRLILDMDIMESMIIPVNKEPKIAIMRSVNDHKDSEVMVVFKPARDVNDLILVPFVIRLNFKERVGDIPALHRFIITKIPMVAVPVEWTEDAYLRAHEIMEQLKLLHNRLQIGYVGIEGTGLGRELIAQWRGLYATFMTLQDRLRDKFSRGA